MTGPTQSASQFVLAAVYAFKIDVILMEYGEILSFYTLPTSSDRHAFALADRYLLPLQSIWKRLTNLK
jgi:hypothetical protein